MKFVIETNLASEPAWWLLDDDNRVVAWAGRAYPSLAYADQAAHDFRLNADDPDYRVQVNTAGSWQWTAWRPEGIRVAVSGDRFSSEAAARSAARRVQQQACTAIGP
ncbi:hypothetical protein ACS3YM_05830 [Nocardia sp. N13]|uniref:hypothetical protein n=1 Tax=Nocardioides sp. N13(2025) TaxID=3453405 RepID=UPI003F768D54